MLIVHLFVSYAHVNLCHFFSSSWRRGLAAASACGSSWTVLFTFLPVRRPYNGQAVAAKPLTNHMYHPANSRNYKDVLFSVGQSRSAIILFASVFNNSIFGGHVPKICNIRLEEFVVWCFDCVHDVTQRRHQEVWVTGQTTPKIYTFIVEVNQAVLRLIIPLVSFGTPWPNS